MSWWSERKARKGRATRVNADPQLRQLYESHASSVMVHLHPGLGIMEQFCACIVWKLDGGTTVFIERDEWYELMERVHKVWNAAPDYVDVGLVP